MICVEGLQAQDINWRFYDTV